MAKRGTSKAIIPEVIDMQPENPELALTVSEGSQIAGVIQGLREFFSTADTLEATAKRHLEKARTWVQPTTQAEDDILIREIRGASAENKAIETHFGPVTSTIFSFHKRFVAGRKRGTDAAEEVARIGNRLHNAYVEGERRRVAEETERLRRAEEAEQQRLRDEELARMEADALRLEASGPELSEREAVFVDAVATGYPARTAYRHAGFTGDADKGVARLLGLVKIVTAIEAKRKAQEVRRQAEAVKAQPINADVEPERMQVSTAGRTTHGAECLDVAALVQAVISGKHGIPWDVLTVNQPKLTDYGRSLHERINLWPGCRYTKKTGVV